MSNWLESLEESASREIKAFNATFRKLRSGDWGAFIAKEDAQEAPRRCDELTIIKRDGSSKSAMVGNVVAEFDNGYLVSLY